MSRNLIFNNALVLRVRPFGEANREASFLTEEEGIVNAAIFGGPKSKFRATVSPFHQGTLYLYHDPVKDSRKVTDFDVKLWRPGLREGFNRAMAAGAVNDTVSATYAGGGNWAIALELTSNYLDALETADESACMRIFVHFLWSWLGLIGEKPSLSRCAVCGASLENGAVFIPLDQALICPACENKARRVDGNSLFLGPGAHRWLSVTENLHPSKLGRWNLDAISLMQARSVVTCVMAGVLGDTLNSWGF
jgi:DNA repair protein RecO (recombination protein O)